MRTIWIARLVWLFSLAAVASGCSDSDSSDCALGAERCSCRQDGSCNQGLSCRSRVCVDLDDGTGGAATGTGGAVSTDGGRPQGGDDGSDGGGEAGARVGDAGAAGTGVGTGGSDETENLILNGDFGMGDQYWDLTLPSEFSAGVEGGEYCIVNQSGTTITTASLGFPLDDADSFSVRAGSTYLFTYRARGRAEVEAKVGGAAEPYTPVTSFMDSIGTDGQTYSHVVTPTADEDQAGIVFNVLELSGSVCFDDVVFMEQ